MANSIDIANLQIRIKDNSEDAAEKVLSLAQALEELKGKSSDTGGLKNVSDGIATLKNADMSGLSRLRKNLANALAPARALAESMERIVDASKGMNRSVVNSVMKASKTTEGLQERVSGTTTSTAPERTTGGRSSNATQQTMELSKKLQNQLDMAKFQEALPSMITDAQAKSSTAVKPNRFKQLGTVMKGVTGTFREFFHVAPNAISRTMSQLGRFMRMRMLRTIVKGVLMGITEGLQNVYQWAKAVGDGFASTMDGMASSVLYLKNSVGAAFAQILTLVAPHINNLIDLIVEGINYVNMFFAVLAGQDTYTRAKKTAVEFGEAASGAIGGASAAAKELKEQLTVLDFDELHQLQEQQEPSSGGGGGGGGGASGTNYADMFEKAKIEQNWLTRTASWLKDNFDDILDVVKAIGAGILAWKISTALSNALDGLLTLKQRVGIAMMVTGFTLEFQGAFNIGKGDATAMDWIKTAIGSALGIAGSLLTFGTGPLGWTIGIGLSITTFIVGLSLGRWEKIRQDLNETDEAYRHATESIEWCASRIANAQERLNNVKTIDNLIDDDEYSKWMFAASLLEKIRSFNGVKVDNANLGELQGYIDSLNNILAEAGLDEYVQFWVDADGIIKTNAEDIQSVIDKMVALAKTNALQGLMQSNYETIYTSQQELDEAKDKRATERQNLGSAQAELRELQAWQQGLLLQGLWYDDPEYYEKVDDLNEKILHSQEAIDDLNKVIDTNQATIDKATEANSYFIEELYGVEQAAYAAAYAINLLSGSKMDLQFNSGTGSVANWRIGNNEHLEQQYQDITGGNTTDNAFINTPSANLNIFSDPTKNALGYAGAVGSVNDAQVGLTASAEQATRETAQLSYGFRGLDKDAGLAVKGVGEIDNALLTIGKGVDIPGIGSGIRTAFVGSVSPAGDESKKAIEKEFDKIGCGVQYPQIMNGINTGLLTAERSTDFASRGTYIGGEMTTGSKGGYLSTDVINGIYSGLDLAQRVTAFSTVGKGIGGDVESGSKAGYSSEKTINTYLDEMLKNQKDTLFSSVGKGIGIDVQKGATENLNAETLMKALYEGLAKATSDMAWSNIGKAIGADIKTGIAYSLQGSTLQLTMAINGRNQSISGRVASASMYALGGFPKVGELFWAGEAGAEAVGTVGGRTAVANREQIASAIAMALQPMLSGGGETTTTVNVNMDSASVARASFKGQRAMKRQYNVQANA